MGTLESGKYTGQVVFSPDGKLLATSDMGKIRIWEVASGREFVPFGDKLSASALAFSSSGRLIAAVERQPDSSRATITTIGLWEVETGTLIRRIVPPAGSAALAFAPDGRSLASGQDSAILIWDLTGRAGKVKSAVALKAAELVALWSDLAADAAKAECALWTLAAPPQQSLPLPKSAAPAAPVCPAAWPRIAARQSGTNRAAKAALV
jgi:WD40 repeat protein